MSISIRSLAALGLTLAISAVGCSGGDGQATGEATTPTSVTQSADPASSTATAPSSSATTASTNSATPTSGPATSVAASTGTAACTEGSATIPVGAARAPVVDVDGDERPDTGWIVTDPSGAVRVGIVTAAGGGFERAFVSASPVTRSILVVAVNTSTPPLVLANDGRSVRLWAVLKCSIADVLNKFDEPYIFSLGFTDIGTGVGCETVRGRQELMGLDAGEPQGGKVPYTSTVVYVQKNRAENGQVADGSLRVGPDDADIERAHSVTCGDAVPIVAPEG